MYLPVFYPVGQALFILKLLYQMRGKVVSRNQLYDFAWGLEHIANSRTIDQHISQLRKKIEEDPKNPTIVKTVHSGGYRFDPE